MKDGQPHIAVDFELLRQELSSVVVDGTTERYAFTWPDKRKAVLLANAPTTKTLRPIRDESVAFDTTRNIYIEGDNLEALKCLRETYLGKIKMIYIDPPYNTGNDFIYEDNFRESAKDYLNRSEQIDKEGNRLRANLETNGRFHTDWLNMIYPRLKIARDFLTDDGVIFISIDDNEVANLKKLCDEVFGEDNFVGNFIWESRTSISNDSEISNNHNHTLIFSKKRTHLTFWGDDLDIKDYINPDNDPRGPWKLVPIDANHAGGDTVYPILNKVTGVEYYPPNGRIWCHNKERMQELIADGRIKFGINDDSAPKKKLFYYERVKKGDKKTPSSILKNVGTTKSGTDEIKSLFDGKKVFDYPKPTSLIYKLIKYAYVQKDDIVLDFFAGSSTTAHAVMKFNADNGGARRFILIQLPAPCDASSVAYKAGYKNICEIGKERIKRAGIQINKDLLSQNKEEIDIGFRVFKVDESNMIDVHHIPNSVNQEDLFEQSENIKHDRTAEDLLIQVMLSLGASLDSSIEQISIDEKTIYNVSHGYILACFDKEISNEVVESIAKEHPVYAVLRDSSFASDCIADNFEQIFKTYAHETICKVI